MFKSFRGNHDGHTVILNKFIYLHQFDVDVCLDGYVFGQIFYSFPY
jgi:hypothetical protein